MNQFVNRPVFSYDMPIPTDVTILKAEQVTLRFENRQTIDIGALCYLQREAAPKGSGRRSKEGRKVLLSSLCPKRIVHIRTFIAHISNELRYGGKRTSTIFGMVGHFIVFMAWVDLNGYSNALDDTASVRIAVSAFAVHIRDRVASHEISLNTGSDAQKLTFSLLSDFLEIEDLTRGVNLLRRNSNTTTSTVPPDEVEQSRIFNLCEALFNGLTTLVLDKRPYPFGIAMPSYLNYQDNIMWVFPVQVWCLSASKLDMRSTNSYCGDGYDHRLGRLSTRDEVMALDKYKDDYFHNNATYKNIGQMLRNAKNNIENANKNLSHWHRRFMGLMALNSFIPLFLSRTGMNWEQVVNLTWDSNFSDAVNTIRQKFRSIKFRAGSKEVYYQLPLKFMPLFKRFLQLRAYLLQEHPGFEGLFFTMGQHSSGSPTLLKTRLKTTYRMLQRIDPELIPILSRGWRAAKSDWLINRTDVSTTSQLLQNSERTVLKSYAAGSVAKHWSEMSTFLNQMVVNEGTILKGSSVNAVGECMSYGSPHEIPGVVAVVPPSCGHPEVGCLFCDKFKIHADEIDVRKLLSCRYCLIRTSHLAGFHPVSGPLIERIQTILDEINSRDALLVPRITKEVEEGELDSYWASKFDMLLRLRLVSDAE